MPYGLRNLAMSIQKCVIYLLVVINNMPNKITAEDLRQWWSKNETIRYSGKLYRVGKMSYGQYFLEPKSWPGGENDGFASDTYWFEKVEKEDRYTVTK
jgi:hypothetical protein